MALLAVVIGVSVCVLGLAFGGMYLLDRFVNKQRD
jgi:uncharacterized protein YneF (UPF0154 family)